MKKIVYICLIFLFACSSENANDCFQTTGSIIRKEIEVDVFNKILVNRDVELILKQGVDIEVIVETGKNLLNDVSVEVINNELILTDNNTCNFVRDYNVTKVYVTSPNIREIRSSTQFKVQSDGIITYPSLKLISEDFIEPDAFSVGDFEMQINGVDLTINSNNFSSFNISGQVQNLKVNFFSGVGRFEGANLIAENVNVFHRGSNDIIVNPQQSLVGELRSTGNLISVNVPPIVDVQNFYTGQLIFD